MVSENHAFSKRAEPYGCTLNTTRYIVRVIVIIMNNQTTKVIPRAIIESRRENIALGYGGKLSRNKMIGLQIAVSEKHACAVNTRIPWHPRSAQLEYEAQLRKKTNKKRASSSA